MTTGDDCRDDVLIHRRDRLAIVRLNRPDRMNALALSTVSRLVETFETLGRDDEIWAVMLTGNGTRAFCAGVDLKDVDALARAGQPFPRPMTGAQRNLFETITECPKPTIAALNGIALCGGLELALACDVRVAHSDVRVGLPEALRGMGAHFASVILPRLIARGQAFDMLYTGRLVDADEAQRTGLISAIWPPAEFENESLAYATRIVGNAPRTLQRYKQMALQGWGLPLSAALRLDVGPDPYDSSDREEGVRAFLEKRPPRWTGR